MSKQPQNTTNIYYKSKFGSKYIFTPEGVYRYSNHWGRVGTCRWRLDNLNHKQQTFFWGFAYWQDFLPNNEEKNLFFIEEVNGLYRINHKLKAPDNITQFRNARDTAKVLKKINEITLSKSWARNISYNNYEDLKLYIINQLTQTSLSYMQLIKKINDGDHSFLL